MTKLRKEATPPREPRRPYQPPRILASEMFERLALACTGALFSANHCDGSGPTETKDSGNCNIDCSGAS